MTQPVTPELLADELEAQPVRTQVHNLGTESQSYGAQTIVLPITLRDRILTALRTSPRDTDREAVLREALEKAVAWFRDYERQHRAKFTTEGDLKADVNADRAAYLEAALNPKERAS